MAKSSGIETTKAPPATVTSGIRISRRSTVPALSNGGDDAQTQWRYRVVLDVHEKGCMARAAPDIAMNVELHQP